MAIIIHLFLALVQGFIGLLIGDFSMKQHVDPQSSQLISILLLLIPFLAFMLSILILIVYMKGKKLRDKQKSIA